MTNDDYELEEIEVSSLTHGYIVWARLACLHVALGPEALFEFLGATFSAVVESNIAVGLWKLSDLQEAKAQLELFKARQMREAGL